MHPDIKAFWEKQGKIIHAYDFSTHKFWFIYSDPEYYNQGGPPPPLKEDTVCIELKSVNVGKRYYLQGANYSEEDMLKVIKMKAFL